MSLYKEEFIDYFNKLGYQLLVEKNLAESQVGNVLVSASIMANKELLESKSVRKVCYQKIFSSNRLDDIGKYPLATPYETMLSIFNSCENSVEEAINSIINFLLTYLNIKKEELFFLCPNNQRVSDCLDALDINFDNRLCWKDDIPLRLGKSENGQYLKIFIPYNGGVIPIATLGFLQNNNSIFVDSALFLERLSFVVSRKNDWFDDMYYNFIYNSVSEVLKNQELETCRRICILLKSAAILYTDGILLTNSGQGYITKKIMKMLVEETSQQFKVSEIESIVKDILKFLNDMTDVHDEVTVLENFIKDYKILNENHDQIMKNVQKYLNRNGNTDFSLLHDRFGLSKMQAIALNSKGIPEILNIPNIENKFWFRNECYKFANNNISNILEFLKNSEQKRIR